MTLGNRRALGVQHLIAYCLNDACRHQALIDGVELSRRRRGGAVVPTPAIGAGGDQEPRNGEVRRFVI
jgi:hypothetical protein